MSDLERGTYDPEAVIAGNVDPWTRGWDSRIADTRTLTETQRSIALALAALIRGGEPRPPIIRLARYASTTERTVRRALGALTKHGWAEQDAAGDWKLTLPPGVAAEPAYPDDAQAWVDCPGCGGTGWRDIPQPAGALTDTPEQPWVRKCQECEGHGRRPAREGEATDHDPQPPPDAELIVMYRSLDQDRRADGYLYRIKGDLRPCPDCHGAGKVEGRAVWPAMNIKGRCGRCHGLGQIGVPPGQRIHTSRLVPESWLPPLADGTRPTAGVES